MLARVRIVTMAMAVALLATAPAFAQKLSLAERVAQLEQESANRTSSSGQANVELLNRLTQLQSEVQALRNQVEQLQNDNEQLKQRAREQYVDLDARLQKLEGGAPAATNSPPPPLAPATAPAMAPAFAPPSAGPSASAAPAADEQSSYEQAFDALKRGDYVASARGFQSFLRDYPNAALAPNAWYWLGESYYVTQNYPVAQKAFEALLGQFPDSGKAPDALLKKGYCQIEMNQAEAGRNTLNQVIDRYPDTDAARLAQSRLRALNLDSH
jgi:tol-pal system protein YbgF